jgi:capsular exopolysaccharide synthesis family protein
VREDIDRYEVSLSELRESIRPAVVERLASLAQSKRQAERREMEASIEAYRLTEQTLRERYQQQLASSAAANSASLDLELVRAELEQEESVHEMLAQRAAALRTELGAPEQVTLLRHAEAPRHPVALFPWKQSAAALLLSLSLPFGLAVVCEWIGRRVRSRQQVEETLALPVVGEVATLPDRRSRNPRAIYLADDGCQYYTESVDRLGASILLAANSEQIQALAVTSAVSGEGKTRTAVQLAISLGGLSQRPVLLIDADLRRPDVHRLLDIDVQPGLREVLDGQLSLDRAIQRRTHQLHVLTAGSCSRHPRELLGDQRFLSLLSELRGRFPHIVVDTPPLLPASESLFVARAVDRVVICARRDFSREPNILKAYEDLMATGVKPLGVVLSGVSRKQYAGAYGSYGYRKYSLLK